MLLIQIPITKNNVPRFFAIHGQFYEICKKYINLRPNNIEKHRRFFFKPLRREVNTPADRHKYDGPNTKTIATWLSLPDPQLYTGHSFRRTSATLLVDEGGDLTDLKKHGGWKSSTVAEGYINESLHHKQEIPKKITKSIALKTINRVHPLKPSIASTFFKNVNVESADKNKQSNVDDAFLDNEFYSLTSTQNATCGSPSKKRNKKETEESVSVKNDNGNISINLENCNVTINIHNHNK